MSFNIFMQFIMQTCLLAGLFIMWQPILSSVAYETTMYDGASLQLLVIRDALWNFGTIIFVIGMAGNVIWLFKALQKQELVAE